MSDSLTTRQREILDCIVEHQNERGYPPSVREIGEAVGLKSPATVKAHLDNLKDAGYLVRDPSKPRAIQVRYEGVRRQRRTPPGSPCPSRRRRRCRYRRAGHGEHRGSRPHARRPHRRR